VCPRFTFDPGTGPDRSWSDGKVSTRPPKRFKIVRVNKAITKADMVQENNKMKAQLSSKVQLLTTRDVVVKKYPQSQKPNSLPPPWVFPEDSEVDSNDSDATVEMEEEELGRNARTPQTGKSVNNFLTPTATAEVEAAVEARMVAKMDSILQTRKRGQAKNEVESNETFALPEDELSVNTGSPRPSPTIRTLLAETSPRWVGGSIQSLVMNSIDWRGLKESVRDEIIRVIDQESMKEGIRKIIEQKVIDKSAMENVDIQNIPTGGVVDWEEVNTTVSNVARKAVFKSICFKRLEKKMVKQLMYAMDFEGLKAKAIEKIVRNGAPVSQLEKLMKSVSDDMDV
jgi:hypothetical protein